MADTPDKQTTLGESSERWFIVNTSWPELVLAETECRFEDGLHVVRSTDFDLIAMHEDFDEAIDQFVEEAHSLFASLGELVKAREATQGEWEVFVKLAVPIVEAHRRDREEEERAQRRLIDFPRFRQRGYRHGHWRPGSNPAKLAHA